MDLNAEDWVQLPCGAHIQVIDYMGKQVFVAEMAGPSSSIPCDDVILKEAATVLKYPVLLGSRWFVSINPPGKLAILKKKPVLQLDKEDQ